MENYYYETKKYRCLIEYDHFLSEELYLSMCGIESCLPGKSFGPVVREGFHLHVILSGRGYLDVEGRQAELHAGQMFMEKPGELTYYCADQANPWSYCWMTFGGTRAGELARAAGFMEGVNVLDCNIDPMRFYKVADSALSNQELSLNAALRRYGFMNEFIALALDSAAASGQNDKQYNYLGSGADYMEYALNYIRRNYAAISVTDIAGYLGISRSHLTRLFKRRMHCSPIEYLMHIRMERSAWLLANTAMSVQEVSSSVGYVDQLTFSKAFKKVYGVSPKYYREQSPDQRTVLKSILYNDERDENTASMQNHGCWLISNVELVA